jgi:hypothetical protein
LTNINLFHRLAALRPAVFVCVCVCVCVSALGPAAHVRVCASTCGRNSKNVETTKQTWSDCAQKCAQHVCAHVCTNTHTYIHAYIGIHTYIYMVISSPGSPIKTIDFWFYFLSPCHHANIPHKDLLIKTSTKQRKSKSAQGNDTGNLPTFILVVESLCLTRV